MTSNRKAEEFLVERGEKPRESSMTDAEYFVLEEIISHHRSNDKELSSENILDVYNYVQSVSGLSENQSILSLRKKELQDVKKALTAHDKEAGVMAALFRKQVEISFTKK